MNRPFPSAILALLLAGCASQAHAGLREPMAPRSDIMVASGQYEVGVAAFRELAAQYPRDPRVWAELGHALVEERKDANAAREACARAADLYRERVQRSPDEIASQVGLVSALDAVGQEEAATAALVEALRHNPRNETLLNVQAIRAARTALQSTPPQAVLVTRMYPVEEAALQKELADKTPEEAKAVLESRGIPFPSGSSLLYVPTRHRLIVRQTPEGHTAVEKLLGQATRN